MYTLASIKDQYILFIIDEFLLKQFFGNYLGIFGNL